MAYNYAAAYGTSYGQYAAQPSSYNTQQTSASGYGHYGQTAAAAYGTASSATTTSTTASSVSSHGYGNTGSSTTTAQSSGTYNFPYNYNYGDSSMYNNAAAAASTALQAFQQSWYSNTSSVATTTVKQSTSTTAQSTTQQQQQQQQYGQYLQQYQQQMSAYQQYANSTAGGKSDMQQQQATAWAAYNQAQLQQRQQQGTTAATNRADASKTGWSAYQQQGMGNQQTGAASQQKSTGVVYRTPMKYTTDTQQYGTSNVTQNYGGNQAFKSPGGNTTQTYTGAAQSYNTQGYGMMGNQNFGGNQYAGAQQQQQQHYGGNQAMKNQTGYQGFQQGQQNTSGYNNQGFGNQGRGGFGGSNNTAGAGGMGMQGSQRGGIAPLMAQRSPMGRAGPGYGNMGQARDGPDIPPFPRAWHSQDDYQGRGFGEQRERWGQGGRGGYSRQQSRGMYNNNSRNARGSNRELWSPAQKSKPNPEKEGKTTPAKKEEGAEKIDKDKHPEIKSYLYAWLGARHTRPTYDIRQIGERPNIMFRCDLRVDNYNFVGVGKATSKKEAQTTAAWKFAEYLIKIGEVTEAELPSKQILTEDIVEGDIGDVRENDGDSSNIGPKDEFVNRNRDRRNAGPNRGGRMNRRGNPNWAPAPDMVGEIQPLMAVQVAPWGAPPPPMGHPPPRLMGPPPPALMDYGPPFWPETNWPPMGMGPQNFGPPIHVRPPPPFMRRSQNDFWRRRDIEERMMDLSRGSDWAQPEDLFISQMIRNQQEGERRQRGQRPMPPMEAIPGEWERVQQSRPVITSDDRHVMSKHAEIYPQEGELKNLHRIVNTVEQALKLLSDKFVDEDHPKEDVKKEEEPEKKEEVKGEEREEKKKETEDEKSGDATAEGESKEEKGEEEKKEESEKKEKEEKKDEKRAKIKILKRPKRVPRQVDTRPRVLCGVNRIGPLAKGLLITKDDHVELALLCGEIPTVKLLNRVMEHIEEKLCEVDEDFKLMVEKKEEEAGFLIKSLDEANPVEVMVILTAMALRKPSEKKSDEKKEEKKEKQDKDKEEKGDKTEEQQDKEETEDKNEETEDKKEETTVEEPDPVGMLPKRKMLDALACLRHTHWFQAKACGIQSCVILTRILRDLQRRDELWNTLSGWALEVLLFNCLISSEEQMSPGDACRRFFEVVAGGILLPDMPGIVDPCEKALQRDVLECLSDQDRESLTRSAQKYLRSLAFREIHVILGMEKLSPSYKSDNHPGQNKSNNKESEQKNGDEKEKHTETNNQRKRRFEHNGNDSVAESPKRSLTDEEDTDTQQNLAELSISDENSEGRSALEEVDGEGTEKDEQAKTKEADAAMETGDSDKKLTKEEEDALLQGDADEEKMEE